MTSRGATGPVPTPHGGAAFGGAAAALARGAAAPPRLARGSVGEVCRTLAAVAWATVRAREAGEVVADTGAPVRVAGPARREEVVRLRTEARAAVGGLVLRLAAGGTSLEQAVFLVKGAARDALPAALTAAESQALAADAVRWAVEAYDVSGRGV